MKNSGLLICIVGVSIASLAISYLPSYIAIVTIIGLSVLLIDNYFARERAKTAEELLMQEMEWQKDILGINKEKGN